MKELSWPRVVALAIGAAVVIVGAVAKADLVAFGTLIIGYAVPSPWLDKKQVQQDSQKGESGQTEQKP